ncbi:oxidoreductase [Daldinia sp. FL1419]|nr:oxidoreductase [Daldinia sp. FL1419]
MAPQKPHLDVKTSLRITLGTGAPGSLTAPPPPLSQTSGAARAQERFRVAGNAIVTGGSGGLGFTACRALLDHGVEGLMIFDINQTAAQAAIDLLSSEFPSAKIRFLKVDVADEDAVNLAVSETVKFLGSVSTLVLCAGIVEFKHALDWNKEDWDRVLNVNLVGGYFVARAVAQSMIEHGIGGSITFIASTTAHRITFPQLQMTYGVSKAGVISLVKQLAAEWARYGIRVNSISPGYIETSLTGLISDLTKIWISRNPMGRMGQPDELEGAIVMLASRAGSYFNGTDLLMDGGQTLFM